MGNFWADKLAGQSPSPQAQSTTAWWDSERAPEPVTELPLREVSQFPTYPQARPAQGPQNRRDASCPECGSGNYMQPGRNAAFRCFDCNYPNMHSTSGANIGSATPHGKPVRQVTGTGWHPEIIVDRLG